MCRQRAGDEHTIQGELIAAEATHSLAIVFGADANLTTKDKVEFKLKNRFNTDIDMELSLSRKLIKGDGKAFLKLLKSKKEYSIYAGMVLG